MTVRHREDWVLLTIAMAEDGMTTLGDITRRLADVGTACASEVGEDFSQLCRRQGWPQPGALQGTLQQDLDDLLDAGLVEPVVTRDGQEPHFSVTTEGFEVSAVISSEVSPFLLRHLRGEGRAAVALEGAQTTRLLS
jgi:DNA-binding transcriptional ArsR family regulator